MINNYVCIYIYTQIHTYIDTKQGRAWGYIVPQSYRTIRGSGNMKTLSLALVKFSCLKLSI